VAPNRDAESGTSPSSSAAPLPLPQSRRYSHPQHLLKHKYIPTSVPRLSAVLADDDTKMKESPVEKPTFIAATERQGSPAKPHKKRKKEIDELEGEKDKKGKKKRTLVE